MPNNDLISRAAARDVINTWGRYENEDIRMDLLHNDLNALPAVDVAPVVRCKECVYLVENPYGPMVCDNMRLFILRPNEFYCAAAARKGTEARRK